MNHKRLTRFIDIFTDSFNPCVEINVRKDVVPCIAYNAKTMEFIELMHSEEFADYDYVAHLEEAGIDRNHTHISDFPLDKYDAKTIMALLMWIVRSERFNEGAIANAIMQGNIQMLLMRLKELDGEAEPGSYQRLKKSALINDTSHEDWLKILRKVGAIKE